MLTHIHIKIINKAFKKKLNPIQKGIMFVANKHADELFKKKVAYDSELQHFNADNFMQNFEFIKNAESMVVDSFKSVAKSRSLKDKDKYSVQAFYSMGRLFHSIQDYYAHTNWINVTGNQKLTLLDSPTLKFSPKLKNCSFSYWEELKDLISSGLKRKFKNKKFYENIYLNPNKKISHGLLNKDYKGAIADQAFEYHFGRSGFKLAYVDAKRHTKQQWAVIKKRLRESLKDEYGDFSIYIEKWHPKLKDIKKYIKDSRQYFDSTMSNRLPVQSNEIKRLPAA